MIKKEVFVLWSCFLFSLGQLASYIKGFTTYFLFLICVVALIGVIANFINITKIRKLYEKLDEESNSVI